MIDKTKEDPRPTDDDLYGVYLATYAVVLAGPGVFSGEVALDPRCIVVHSLAAHALGVADAHARQVDGQARRPMEKADLVQRVTEMVGR